MSVKVVHYIFILKTWGEGAPCLLGELQLKAGLEEVSNPEPHVSRREIWKWSRQGEIARWTQTHRDRGTVVLESCEPSRRCATLQIGKLRIREGEGQRPAKLVYSMSPSSKGSIQQHFGLPEGWL